MKERMDFEPLFCKSEDEIFALVPTSDGGNACWVWRDGSWRSIYFSGAFQDGIFLSRDEVISLIGRAAVESLPGGR